MVCVLLFVQVHLASHGTLGIINPVNSCLSDEHDKPILWVLRSWVVPSPLINMKHCTDLIDPSGGRSS